MELSLAGEGTTVEAGPGLAQDLAGGPLKEHRPPGGLGEHLLTVHSSIIHPVAVCLSEATSVPSPALCPLPLPRPKHGRPKMVPSVPRPSA